MNRFSVALGSLPLLVAQTLASAQVCVPLEQTLTTPHPACRELGSAVALDGETAVLGARTDTEFGLNAGGAYVFVRSGGGWVEQAKLVASDAAPSRFFGTSVAIQGDSLVVGSPGIAGSFNRKVYLFERQAGNWSEVAQLVAPASVPSGYFGRSVARQGATVVVGAPALNFGVPGRVVVYVLQGTNWVVEAELQDPTSGPGWPRDFGHAVALDGDLLAVGVPNAGQNNGGIVVYRRTAGAWNLEQTLLPPDAGTSHRFGFAVAAEGERIVGGSPDLSTFAGTGSVYVFEKEGGGWFQRSKITPVGASAGARFGHALSLSGDSLLVGAWRDVQERGAAYFYRRVGPDWVQLTRQESGAGSLGWAVAIQGEHALASRPFLVQGGTERGAVERWSLPLAAGVANCHCPAGQCGNPDPDAGCANSTGGGASLIAIGGTNPDAVTFFASGAPPGRFSAFIQADQFVPPLPFGAGLRCSSGNLRILNAMPRPVKPSGTLGLGSCAGDPPISSLGGVVPGSGIRRQYQLWYRDPTGPCGASFNLSNGVEIVW